MKKILSIILGVSLFTGLIFAQQDPEAKKILDRVADKTRQYTTLETDFSMMIENRREDFSSKTEGTLKIKGEKYYMESAETKVFCNGKTVWTYMEDINEVTITEVEENSDDFVENPIVILDFYNRDLKYRLLGETKVGADWMYEIDLFPKDLEQPYSSFKVLITKDTEELYLVKAVGKDGIDYTAKLENWKHNQTMDDTMFTFRKAEYKGVEVVDLRF